MNRFTATLRARLRVESEPDRGSALLGAVLFSVIIAGMAVVLLSIIVTAVYPAALAQARGRTVYNAEAGLQSALGILRAAKVSPATVDAKTGSYLGDRAKLPCSISGTVDGITGSDEVYEVALRYYDDDHNPSGQTDAWRAANALPCPLGSASTQPYYALIEATGSTGAVATSGDAGDRKLSAIYEFTVSNERILGGRIYTYGGGKYCLEASAVPPASGEPSTPITIKFTPAADCTPTAARNAVQLWEYTTDWRLKLSSTVAEDGTGGYCITAPNQTTTTLPATRTTISDTWYQTGEAYSGQPSNPTYIRRTTTDTASRAFTATERARDTPYRQVQYSGTQNAGSTTWYTYASSAQVGTPAVTTVPNAYGAGTQQVTTVTTYRDRYNRSSSPTARYVTRVETLVERVDPATTVTTNSYAAELHPCIDRATSYGWAQIFAWNGAATWWGLSEGGTHNSVSTTACMWSGKFPGDPAPAESSWALTSANVLMIGKPTKVTTGPLDSQERCASQQYWGSFNPEPAVGAGRATPNFVDGHAVPVTKQLVSFKEFGRCADVTGANIANADSVGEYNIVYPCKQDPISNAFDWNHKWNYNSPTLGYTVTTPIWVNNGSNHCLQTPDPATSGKYPIWAACGVTNPATTLPTSARLKWTRYEYTGVYSRSYIFVDQWNRCLTADSADLFTGAGQAWSKMTVAPCNGSESQKWNAPAYLTDASFGDYREITG